MKHVFPIVVLLTVNINVNAQQSSIEGTWKGTSLCQVKSSPCHDESAVYHISRSANGKTYTMQANKMVNGVEEEMGSSDAVYDEGKHTLTTTTKDSQGRSDIWLFKIEGKQMHGTLTLEDRTVYRIIDLKKVD